MIYLAYQTHTDVMEPLRALARIGAAALNDPLVVSPGAACYATWPRRWRCLAAQC
jgi:hypothetical protein